MYGAKKLFQIGVFFLEFLKENECRFKRKKEKEQKYDKRQSGKGSS